jgi:glycosyltransferase involved in cell wall biosynthesis
VPSRKESFPYVVLEAAAAGIPLVASHVGGIPEIVDGTDTPLVPIDDVGRLAAALRAAIENPAAARARAQRLRAEVQNRFTVDRMAREVVHFYAACAHKAAA